MLKVGFKLNKTLLSKSSGIYKSTSKLAKAISNNKVWKPSIHKNFIFLCGGAGENGKQLSARRNAIVDFGKKQLKNCTFFSAEEVFDVLQIEDPKVNLLELENSISNFADFIIVILESISAFCELGAFSSNIMMREKMVVINDSQHKNSRSFINLGPLQAIEKKGKGSIIYYRMNDQLRLDRVDNIGEIFTNLYKLLLVEQTGLKRTRLLLSECKPDQLNKDAMMIVSDIITLTGPVRYAELIEIIKSIFGSSNYNYIKQILGLLKASGEVEFSSENRLYSPISSNLFFEYDSLDITEIKSSFRLFFMKTDPGRYNR